MLQGIKIIIHSVAAVVLIHVLCYCVEEINGEPGGK